MEGKGELLTRTLTANNGKKHLFVNVNVPAKGFRAELLHAEGTPIEGYGMEDCIPVGGDSTCKRITWKNGKTLDFLNGKEFRVRFSMNGGEFYAFWLSSDENGTSLRANFILFPKKII